MDKPRVLEHIFNPKAVAVVGATDNPTKQGHWCVQSLLEMDYPGKIFPINPNRKDILGMKAHASVKEIPGEIDLAVVVVPAPVVSSVLAECADKGAKGAVVVSSGFREKLEPGGPRLENEIKKVAGEKKIRVIGPNTFGLVHMGARLNATFSPVLRHLKTGGVSMVGQSGGVCHIFMYSALHDGVGLNKVMGLGNRCDMDFVDVVDYLENDPGTRSIALYVEGLEDPRSLLQRTKSICVKKPIVALKGGKTDAIQKASVAHTGAMAGRYDLYEASFRQSGIVTVNDPVELVDVAKALAVLDPPKGDKVAVISIQAGPGILMTDLCIEKGLPLARFEKKTLERLQIPKRDMTLRANPVDLGYALTPEPFQEAVEIVIRDSNVDALVVGLIDPLDYFTDFISDNLIELAKGLGKPMLVSYMLGSPDGAKKGSEDLEGRGVPNYPNPLRAVNALAGMVRYGRMLRDGKKQG
jgi:acyl-CoA synthetase (NDP forming)